MGQLIYFRAAASVDQSRSAPSASTGAQILFFTGVRYQRHPPADLIDPNAGSSSPPRGGMDGAGRGKRKRRG
jgi:hypothetical protein